MIKKLSITFGCLLLMAGLSFGQTSFSFSDNNGDPLSGTYNPGDTFTLTLSGTWVGYSAVGFSSWLETNATLAPFIKITGASFLGATWTSPNDDPADYDPGFSPFPKVFTSIAGRTNSNFLTSVDSMGTDGSTPPRTGDLGATGSTRVAGTYTLTNITFQLTGAPAGTFTLGTTTVSPRGSQVTEASTFISHPASAALYTLTVVPEPSTWSLVAIGALGAVGFGILRRRQRA